MSSELTLLDPFRKIHKNSLIGFDELFERIKELEKPQTGYPPYNIIRKNNSEFEIKLAVAGFSKETLSVALENGKLSIRGSAPEGIGKIDYIYQGIAERAFSRVFTLSDTVEVDKVTLSDGMLTVALKNIIPEHKKAKEFKIE